MTGGPSGAFVTSDPGLLAAAAALRHRVFVEEQGVAAALEADGRDGIAAHVVLTEAGRVIGTARLFDSSDRAIVGRVAVEAGLRGRGQGAAVMRAAERWTSEAGLPVVELHSQEPVIGFYEKLGYTGVGTPYLEAGIPHLTMRKELLPGLRPVRDEDSAAIEALIGGIWAEYPTIVLDVDGEEPWMRAPATSYDARGELWVMPLAEGDGLLACVGWRPSSGGAELKSLYVSAAARRRGLGSRLVHFIERRVGGRAKLTAWSDTRFLDSHRMYERLGYRRTGSTRELDDKSQTVEFEFVGQAVG